MKDKVDEMEIIFIKLNPANQTDQSLGCRANLYKKISGKNDKIQ